MTFCRACLEMSNEAEVVGDELQKISVMKNLPALIKEDLNACIQRIIPRMQQTLPHGTTEYNMGACEAVRTVATENLMSSENFTKIFLQHILNSLESRDTVAAGEWLNVLLDVIQVLPTSVLQSEVLPIAVNKAHISKPVPVRITSCKILARLSLSFTHFLVKKDIIPVVISLCQDVSGDVRAAMSAELPSISTTLGLETGNYLLNHVLDLVSDEESSVCEAAIEALAEMLPRFPPEVLKNTIFPLTKKVFGEIMKNEDTSLVILSRFYGKYAIGMKAVMTVVERGQFLQRYIQLSQFNSNNRRKLNPYKPIVTDEDDLALRFTDCRLYCAFNLPAMVLFSQDLKQDLVDALFGVFRNLASDSYFEVRKKIAAGFYEVMKMMPKWHSSLKAEFIKLLKDEVDLVLEGLVPNVSNILHGFHASNTISCEKVESGKDVGQALFICEKLLAEGCRWRLHEELLLALRAVPRVFHSEFVYLYFVPLLMSRAINGRILPCRVAALHTLLVIIVDPSQAKQKLKIRNKILELCNNSSFHCRLLFLRGMNILLALSPEVLKELFFHNITSMADDKVANIRLVVCQMLPRLNRVAVDPVDRKLLAGVDAALAALGSETDRDVLAQLKTSIRLVDEVDRSKGIKRANTDIHQDSQSMTQKSQHSTRFPGSITPLTDIRSLTSFQSDRSPSYFSVNSKLSNPKSKITGGPGSRTQRTSISDRSQSQTSSRLPAQRATLRNKILDQKKPSTPFNKLTPEDFLVDAGIPLKSTTAVKRIPTPRPVHRAMLVPDDMDELYQHDNVENRNNPRQSLPSPFTRPTLSPINKNSNINNRPSSLPVKKSSYRSLTNEEIEKELFLHSESQVSPRTPRMLERLSYAGKPLKTLKKESKRYSLDVAEITTNYARMETRNGNANKRYSLDVDSKKDVSNKKSLSCINNNTLISPRLGSTRSGIVRPQSCVLQTEKVNHSKRSMSVENLPPKVTRLTSRLPVRASDPKPSKPK